MKKQETYLQNIHILYTVNRGFKKDVDEIRNAPRAEYDEIIKKHKLPEVYSSALGYFIEESDDPSKFFGGSWYRPKVFTDKSAGFEQDSLAMMLPRDLTLRDLQGKWGIIKEAIDEYYGSEDRCLPPSMKNAYRDIEIFKLKQHNKTGKEISKIINKKYSDNPIEYQEVSKIIKRLRERANKIVGGK